MKVDKSKELYGMFTGKTSELLKPKLPKIDYELVLMSLSAPTNDVRLHNYVQRTELKPGKPKTNAVYAHTVNMFAQDANGRRLEPNQYVPHEVPALPGTPATEAKLSERTEKTSSHGETWQYNEGMCTPKPNLRITLTATQLKLLLKDFGISLAEFVRCHFEHENHAGLRQASDLSRASAEAQYVNNYRKWAMTGHVSLTTWTAEKYKWVFVKAFTMTLPTFSHSSYTLRVNREGNE